MTDEISQQQRLDEPFAEHQIKTLEAKGGLDYVPVAEVIARMNDVLGTGKWTAVITSAEKIETSAIVQVSVTAEIDGNLCSAPGIGGAQVRSSMELGDTFKSAYSDALKKACQRLGVGLHLARDEEPVPVNVEVEEWSKVMSFVKQLDESDMKKVAAWWDENAGGRPKTWDTINADPHFWEAFKDFARPLFTETPEENAETVNNDEKQEAGSPW